MRNLVSIAPLALLCAAAPLLAQNSDSQAGVDYAGFVELAGELGEYRENAFFEIYQPD